MVSWSLTLSLFLSLSSSEMANTLVCGMCFFLNKSISCYHFISEFFCSEVRTLNSPATILLTSMKRTFGNIFFTKSFWKILNLYFFINIMQYIGNFRNKFLNFLEIGNNKNWLKRHRYTKPNNDHGRNSLCC